MTNVFRKPKKASEYCAACPNNSKKNPIHSYFRFPKEENRCNEWKLRVMRVHSYTAEQCYKRFRVCSAHFEESMFSSMQKNKLKRNAIPTIFEEGSIRVADASSGKYVYYSVLFENMNRV
ncbi:hypothetical protein JTB14_032115 [Gonioctena quinquepunctata]|nr:hypothetical protein JTB14_032115 [Gonioctena quinquepunctata]